MANLSTTVTVRALPAVVETRWFVFGLIFSWVPGYVRRDGVRAMVVWARRGAQK